MMSRGALRGRCAEEIQALELGQRRRYQVRLRGNRSEKSKV
jgi:hypothetical protein